MGSNGWETICDNLIHFSLVYQSANFSLKGELKEMLAGVVEVAQVDVVEVTEVEDGECKFE